MIYRVKLASGAESPRPIHPTLRLALTQKCLIRTKDEALNGDLPAILAAATPMFETCPAHLRSRRAPRCAHVSPNSLIFAVIREVKELSPPNWHVSASTRTSS